MFVDEIATIALPKRSTGKMLFSLRRRSKESLALKIHPKGWFFRDRQIFPREEITTPSHILPSNLITPKVPGADVKPSIVAFEGYDPGHYPFKLLHSIETVRPNIHYILLKTLCILSVV